MANISWACVWIDLSHIMTLLKLFRCEELIVIFLDCLKLTKEVEIKWSLYSPIWRWWQDTLCFCPGFWWYIHSSGSSVQNICWHLQHDQSQWTSQTLFTLTCSRPILTQAVLFICLSQSGDETYTALELQSRSSEYETLAGASADPR